MRIILTALFLVLCLSFSTTASAQRVLLSCDGPDPNYVRKVRGLSPLPPPADTTFDEKLIKEAEIAFIGVVEPPAETKSPAYSVFRVLKPIKGVSNDSTYPHLPMSCDDLSVENNQVWLRLRLPAPPTTPAPPMPEASGAIDFQTGRHWTKEELEADWKKNWQEQFQPIEKGYLLRDACGKVTSPLKVAQIKENYGFDVAAIPEVDVAELTAKAEKNDVQAERALSKHYECVGNKLQASKWFSKAQYLGALPLAEKGNGMAAYQIGILFAEGAPGWEKNPHEAEKWLRISALSDFLPQRELSQKRLAQMYLDGDGFPQDKAEGLFWLALLIQESHGHQKDVVLCQEPEKIMNPGISMKKEQGLCEQTAKELTSEQITAIKSRVETTESNYCKTSKWFCKPRLGLRNVRPIDSKKQVPQDSGSFWEKLLEKFL